MTAIEQNDAPGVFVGKNDYLFLSDGGHSVFDYALGKRSINDTAKRDFRQNLDRRKDFCEALDIALVHVIVPDKQSVLAELVPMPIEVRLGEIFAAECNEKSGIFYLRSFLENLVNSPYLQTDTHLTHEATIRVAAWLVDVLGDVESQEGQEFLLAGLRSDDAFTVGDLGSKFDPGRGEIRSSYRGIWETHWTHNQPFEGNNGIIDIRMSRHAISGKRLVMFGDSFGRDISWFLSYFYREVIFCRTPFFHDEIVRDMEPDIVICQCAERYLENVQSDDVRPAFLLYPFLTGRSYMPGQAFIEALNAILSHPRIPYQNFVQKFVPHSEKQE